MGLCVFSLPIYLYFILLSSNGKYGTFAIEQRYALYIFLYTYEFVIRPEYFMDE